MLQIKEVAPHTTVSAADEMFWKRDLPVARHCYKTLKGKESLDMAKFAKETAKEWKVRKRILLCQTVCYLEKSKLCTSTE